MRSSETKSKAGHLPASGVSSSGERPSIADSIRSSGIMSLPLFGCDFALNALRPDSNVSRIEIESSGLTVTFSDASSLNVLLTEGQRTQMSALSAAVRDYGERACSCEQCSPGRSIH